MCMCHPHIFFDELSGQIFNPLSNWTVYIFLLLLSYKSSLCNMDTYPLSEMCFENISSQYVACLSYSNIVFCTVVVFILILPNLLTFSFLNQAFCMASKNMEKNKSILFLCFLLKFYIFALYV